MSEAKRFEIKSPTGTFGGLRDGDHFILLPAGNEAPLMKKTGADSAMLLYNSQHLTRLERTHQVQRIKT